MATSSFRLVTHRQGFWDAVTGQAYDVVSESEGAVFASIKLGFERGSLVPGLTIRMAGSGDATETAYMSDTFDSLNVPGLGYSYSIHASAGPLRYLCLVAQVPRLQLDAVHPEAAGVSCPIVLSVATVSGRELMLAGSRERVAEFRHPWRDGETKKGTVELFTVAPNLSDGLHLVAVLAAAAEAIHSIPLR